MINVLKALTLCVLITRIELLSSENRTDYSINMIQKPISSRITQRVCGPQMKQRRNIANLKIVSRIDSIQTVKHHPVKVDFNEVFRKANEKNLVQIGTNPNDHIRASECAKIAFINCQSMKNKSDILLDYIVQNDLDACFLAETWLQNDNDFALKSATPNGYNYYSKPRSNGNKGGGIATIFKKETNCKELNLESAYNSFEHQTLEIDINGTKCIFAIIYRVPPSSSNKVSKALFITEFARFIEPIALKKQNIIVCGDFNIHWDNKNHPETKKMVDLLNTFGLSQHVNDATHTFGHTVDWIISRSDSQIVSQCVIDEFISDHYAIKVKTQSQKYKI